MSIRCESCGAIAGKGFEIVHRRDCKANKTGYIPISSVSSVERFCSIHQKSLIYCEDCAMSRLVTELSEERVNKLYIVNTASQWAKDQLQILINMMSDREANEALSPLKEEFIISELKRILSGIRTVNC